MPTYKQPVKNAVRTTVLAHAVASLTTHRSSLPLVRADEFRETVEYVIRFLDQFQWAKPWFQELRSESEQFLRFHGSQVGTREPQDLRVLYLSGPEPLNDLSVLLSLGIIPQNIWAIETEKSLYQDAINQLREHDSYIRIHHGKLESFFQEVNERFDLIYIDACGPLPSGKPNTLKIPLAMIEHERLTSVGMLITNFAEPSDDRRALYSEMMAQYFAPRYTDCPLVLQEDGADPAEAHHDPDYLRRYIDRRFEATYSEFVTRFVVDIARSIIPQKRIISNPELRRKYFAAEDALNAARRRATAPPTFHAGVSNEELVRQVVTSMGDLHLNPAGYPVHTFLRRVSKQRDLSQLLEPLFSVRVDGQPFVDAMLTTGLIENIIEGHVEAASSELLAAIQGSWFDSRGGLFCDVPMPNLLVNSLFGIYSHPYLVNPRRSIRHSYVAKSTRMYIDCLALDQCRYYFDYWPTIDLVPRRFRSPTFQLVLRACLDRMVRHDWSSSSHPFRGSTLASFGDIAIADAYDFDPRSELSVPEEKLGGSS